jgi:hypothetical protein
VKATGVLPGRFERRPPAPVLRGLDFSIGAPDMAPPTTGDHPRIDRLDGALWLSDATSTRLREPAVAFGGRRPECRPIGAHAPICVDAAKLPTSSYAGEFVHGGHDAILEFPFGCDPDVAQDRAASGEIPAQTGGFGDR